MKRVIKATDNIENPIVVVVDSDGAVTPLGYTFQDYEHAKDFCELHGWTCSEHLDRYLRGRLEIRDKYEFHSR